LTCPWRESNCGPFLGRLTACVDVVTMAIMPLITNALTMFFTMRVAPSRWP
jgi:hypothetical protein